MSAVSLLHVGRQYIADVSVTVPSATGGSGEIDTASSTDAGFASSTYHPVHSSRSVSTSHTTFVDPISDPTPVGSTSDPTPVGSTTSQTQSTKSPDPPESGSQSSDSLSPRLFVPLAVVSSVLTVLLVFCFWRWCVVRRRRERVRGLGESTVATVLHTSSEIRHVEIRTAPSLLLRPALQTSCHSQKKKLRLGRDKICTVVWL